MNHLLVCREFPPTRFPAGGIGTYGMHVARLLAAKGDVVHVIAQAWGESGDSSHAGHDGRLTVHRLAVDQTGRDTDDEIAALSASAYPEQVFAWRAALLAERLVDEAAIDVIEAQEWEAPLYHFQLRRSLGLGPSRRPPCLVHLHSPSELIAEHNGWTASRPDQVVAQRLERSSIAWADAWLCPSRFLAMAAERRFDLPADAVRVIPLPMGDCATLKRTPEVWAGGSLLYIGRLEPRKGVVEWTEAAVLIARRHSAVTFEFVGADLPFDEAVHVSQVMRSRIPDDLQSRFIFHGEQPRSALPGFLARARVVVVPSRWENFPNTCVEAMASGAPVLATRQGGMAEMIVDGVSGWLVDTATRDELAAGAERALAADPATLERMGREASKAIRVMCDPSLVAERHLAYRRELLDRVDRPPLDEGRTAEQSPRPVRVDDGDVVVVRRSEFRARIRALRESTTLPLAMVVLDNDTPAVPGLMTAGRDVLSRRTDVGVMTWWGAQSPAWRGTNPSFPLQLVRDECAGGVLIRGECLLGSLSGLEELPDEFLPWAIVNAIIASGWTAITYPGVLIRATQPTVRTPTHSQWWPAVLAHTPEPTRRYLLEIAVFLEADRERIHRRMHQMERSYPRGLRTAVRFLVAEVAGRVKVELGRAVRLIRNRS